MPMACAGPPRLVSRSGTLHANGFSIRNIAAATGAEPRSGPDERVAGHVAAARGGQVSLEKDVGAALDRARSDDALTISNQCRDRRRGQRARLDNGDSTARTRSRSRPNCTTGRAGACRRRGIVHSPGFEFRRRSVETRSPGCGAAANAATASHDVHMPANEVAIGADFDRAHRGGDVRRQSPIQPPVRSMTNAESQRCPERPRCCLVPARTAFTGAGRSAARSSRCRARPSRRAVCGRRSCVSRRYDRRGKSSCSHQR
jgi:hypothetical protein